MFKTLLFGLTFLIFLGCSGMGVHHKNYDNQIREGAYKEAAQEVIKDKDNQSDIDDAHLLETLKAGNAYLYAGDFNASTTMLEEAERILQYHRKEILAGSAADYLAQILLTDAVVDYHGTMYDSIMINTYKALNYMMMHDYASARVELNRAIDRQRRAKETYAELIAKQKEAIAEKEKSKEGASTQKTLNNPKVQSIIEKNYSNLGEYKAYPDFINPFSTYLAGLFFYIEGDYAKAEPLLKEAYAMLMDNSVVKSDFEMVEYALDAQVSNKRYAWIIYENGLGPSIDEIKVDVPLFLVTNEVIYTGIALPRMSYGKSATSALEVLHNKQNMATTEVVADLNRVIYTEYRYTYKDIVTRAILSALVKTTIQYQAKQINQWAGLAAAIYQSASTHADTRIWSSLPQRFEVAKVEIPQDNTLTLKAGRHTLKATLDDDAKYAIIHVRIATAYSKPSLNIANFKE